ncbi:hypothetical protein EDB89DRAFT_402914 [Lactarius sanguifluus]|nr:hypothetical protein EDB89DRAFT_402914 [Lactarius sanguifluus]
MRNFVPRGSVRDRFRLPVGLYPPFPSPTSLHRHAPLALQHRSFHNHHGPMYDTAHSAEACTTASDIHVHHIRGFGKGGARDTLPTHPRYHHDHNHDQDHHNHCDCSSESYAPLTATMLTRPQASTLISNFTTPVLYMVSIKYISLSIPQNR